VRLRQGKADAVTFSDPDPVAVARGFADAGARRLHIIDLDGALGRPSGGLEVLRRVVSAVDIPVQFGGGLRDMASLTAALEAGAAWVICGTAALDMPGFVSEAARTCGDRLIVALDLRRGRPQVRGWQGDAQVGLAAALDLIGASGVRNVLVTDTAADGTLVGIDVLVLQPVLDRPFGVIAAGGVSTLEDVTKLAALAHRGITGIVCGSALLAGRFALGEAQAAAECAAAAAMDGET
jgi:phosphoribosylformimino-5-aminoimidazole carboxamide ribotide isomerase